MSSIFDSEEKILNEAEKYIFENQYADIVQYFQQCLQWEQFDDIFNPLPGTDKSSYNVQQFNNHMDVFHFSGIKLILKDNGYWIERLSPYPVRFVCFSDEEFELPDFIRFTQPTLIYMSKFQSNSPHLFEKAFPKQNATLIDYYPAIFLDRNKTYY